MIGKVLCFGELLLRLGAPGRERLLQTPRLEIHVGGAEANVAVSLACLGHASAMVSVLPDHALGDAAIVALRAQGVDTRAILRVPGRVGLYFLATGALQRPSEVLYDRAGSAFALTPPEAYDWPALLDGVDRLHLSGVTPATGANGAAAAIDAVEAARARGVAVSFDGNYRQKLWAAWEGDAPALLGRIVSCADLLFADQRDLTILLGEDALGNDGSFERAAQRAFEAFPLLERIATMQRRQLSVDHHILTGLLATRQTAISTAAHTVFPIVDRIGAGDAFAAGLLHALRQGRDDRDALELATAAGCLKHSSPGDSHLARADELEAFVSERGFDVRR